MDQQSREAIGRQLQLRIDSKSLQLPMLPRVTSEVLALINDSDSDAAALAQLIQRDQALAGHVMRIANSAAYSPTTKMTSLQQATARLGMQAISEIALAATMGPKLFDTPGFENLVSDIWTSSLATALWAKEIARLGRRNVESAFLSGLLFQIGKPVVLQAVLEIAAELSLQPDTEMVTVLISEQQKRAGLSLADYWQLPSAVQETIQFVDTPEASGPSRAVVDTVRASQLFSAITLGDRNYQLDVLSVNDDLIALNLYEQDIEQLLAKADLVHAMIEALNL